MDDQVRAVVSANERVLHVDDEPMICEVTRLCLEKGGHYKVDVVHTAEEALHHIQAGSYSCVISDYDMPKMNGLELLQQIRKFDADIPFILFSGKGRESVVIDAINTGADFIIQKGGDAKTLFAELNHKVEYAITKRNQQLSLKRRDAILEAVSLVATLFLCGESFTRALKESITLFGLSTEVDRVLIFQKEEHEGGEQIYRKICGWSRLDESDINEPMTISPGSSFPYENRLLHGEPVVGSVAGFSAESRTILDTLRIRSLAAFPVVANQQIWGMIWFCDCISERTWPVVEIDALQAAASIVGSAIHQDQMRSDLVTTNEQYESMYSMMRQLCDSVPDMLWAQDTDGKFIFVNEAASRDLLGAPDTSEPIGRYEADYLVKPITNLGNHSENGSLLLEETGVPPSTRTSARISGPGTPRSSSDLKLDIRKVPFVDKAGHLIGEVAIGRKITDDDEIRCSLQVQQKKYSRIFQQIKTAIILCYPDGSVFEVNPSGAALFGKDEREMIGINIHSLHGLGDTGILRDFSAAQALKFPVRGESRYPDRSGIPRKISYEISPCLDARGKVGDLLLTIEQEDLLNTDFTEEIPGHGER